MSAPRLSTVATDLVQTYGNTARNVINAYRAGGERIGELLEQRYVSALEASAAQLAPEVRENALITQKIVSAYYVKGISLASDSAQAMVDNLVKYTGMGVEQAAANAAKYGDTTGAKALGKLTQVALPAAVAASELANRIEEKTAALAAKLGAGSLKGASAFRKARARQA